MPKNARGWLPIALLALSLTGSAWAKEKRPPIPEDLPTAHRQWLEEVALLISDTEREVFLGLTRDYQRDAFIERFWDARDPYPETGRNELRDDWRERLRRAEENAFGADDVRRRFALLAGWPDRRAEIDCPGVTVPIEVWFYERASPRGQPFALVFYRRWSAGPWRPWLDADGLPVLFEEQSLFAEVDTLIREIRVSIANGKPELVIAGPPGCDFDQLVLALHWIFHLAGQGPYVYDKLVAKLEAPPPPASAEWVQTFVTYSTDLPAEAETFPAELAVDFPGRRGGRVAVRGVLGVELARLAALDLDGHRGYGLTLSGEVLREDKLFERFRYAFDAAAEELDGERWPLVFQRYLRPGSYRLILRLDDLGSGRVSRLERTLTVPSPAAPASGPVTETLDPVTARAAAAADRALEGESEIELVLPFGELLTGLLRFDTLVVGEQVDHVTFWLDGRPVATKREPPFSLELDLGPLPRRRPLRITAHDAAGAVVAADEAILNASPHRFAVRLAEPLAGSRHGESVRARVEVVVPPGEELERVELFVGEERRATLFEEPFVQPLRLDPPGDLALVRAVGHLAGGASAEDVVIVNGADAAEEMDVDLVELYTTVTGRDRRPISGLEASDFTVYENGEEQRLVRFERVDDLPIHAVILLDVSASMESRIERVRAAALSFFERAIRPRGQDRVAAILFNDRPRVAVPFTAESERFAQGLAAMRAERGTALYDSLVYALFFAGGLPGQRAVLLLSDGVDELSRYDFDQALEYARRARVTIYAVGIDLDRGEGSPKKTLGRFAAETGGRSFFIQDAAELDGVYAAILEELRAQYLLAYQSTGGHAADRRARDAYREIEVEVHRRGAEAKTLRGYYP